MDYDIRTQSFSKIQGYKSIPVQTELLRKFWELHPSLEPKELPLHFSAWVKQLMSQKPTGSNEPLFDNDDIIAIKERLNALENDLESFRSGIASIANPTGHL